MTNVPFGNLRLQYDSIRDEAESALQQVLDSGWFILGQQVSAFEEEFAAYVGARYAVGVGNGTEALQLAVMALDIGPGDEVLTVPLTACFTALAISATGATPTFVDIRPDSFNMDPEQIETRITPRTRAIMPVHLYGQSADMDPIMEIAERRGLYVIEDAAQAHGAEYKGRRLGSIGHIGCFSFYPSKNLGAYGDGGLCVTNDPALAERLRLLRNGGQSKRYHHEMLAINSRLDEMQAALLRAKLRHLDEWNDARRRIAHRYDELLAHSPVTTPVEMAYGKHVYHLYVVRSPARDRLQAHLEAHGVGTQVHYPIPLHLQGCYRFLGGKRGDYPVAERAAEEILSLPIYPELTDDQVEYVAEVINRWVP